MLELVMAMVISSLVISMVYVIYDNLSRQVIVYSKQQDELMAYNQFQAIFSKEVQLSKSLQIPTDNSIVLSVNDKEVRYVFEKQGVLRKGETIETFMMPIVAVNFNQKETIEEQYRLLKFKTILLGTEVDFFESKEISLAERINTYLLSEY